MEKIATSWHCHASWELYIHVKQIKMKTREERRVWKRRVFSEIWLVLFHSQMDGWLGARIITHSAGFEVLWLGGIHISDVSHAASQISAPEDGCAVTPPPPRGHPAGDEGMETNWILIHIFKKSLYVQQEKPATSRLASSSELRVIGAARFIDSSEPHSRVNTLEARWEPRQQLYDSQIVD